MDKYVTLVGSRARNDNKHSSDHDYIALYKNIDKIKKVVEKDVLKKYYWGNQKLSFLDKKHNKIDIFGVSSIFWGKLIWTLPKEKIIGLRRLAKEKGMKLTNDGLFKGSEQIHVKNLQQLKSILKS